MTVPVGGGVLPVDKPEGPTSHDIVERARRALRERRVGHTGTLDPFASGLLLLCVGSATRLSQYLTGQDKEYVARARLGVSTDTLDREGKVVAESGGWRDLSPQALETALGQLRGEILQVPPRFSAKKVGGVAAHRRVRRGEVVELPAVPVTVHELVLTEVRLPEVELRLVCSSGTYVRALARDLGESLGVGAHLTALRRTRVGGFRVEDAVPGDFAAPVPDAAWISPLDALGDLPRMEVDAAGALRLGQGQRLPVGNGAEGLTAVHHRGRLLAVCRCSEGVLHPEKVFPPESEPSE
ncbi:MAG TPA: tRNA pseudouridine(55) synthase TruB [Longimicrobiales bacterium]|nr:tRNA pseudouridine(55) synthase TruB [Longimicrobiales bacterium]